MLFLLTLITLNLCLNYSIFSSFFLYALWPLDKNVIINLGIDLKIINLFILM